MVRLFKFALLVLLWSHMQAPLPFQQKPVPPKANPPTGQQVKTAGVIGNVFWIKSYDMDGNPINIPTPGRLAQGRSLVRPDIAKKAMPRDIYTNREYRTKRG